MIFKSVSFAIMVSKFDNVRPKLYFTPLMVINFRNKTPVLQFRVMNSQGTLLDVENLTAQWAKPTRSEEGETFGKCQFEAIIRDLTLKSRFSALSTNF